MPKIDLPNKKDLEIKLKAQIELEYKKLLEDYKTDITNAVTNVYKSYIKGDTTQNWIKIGMHKNQRLEEDLTKWLNKKGYKCTYSPASSCFLVYFD